MAWNLVASVKASSVAFASFSTDPIDTSGADLIVVGAPRFTGAVEDNKGNTYSLTGSESTTGSADAMTLGLFMCAAPVVGTNHIFSLGPGSVTGVLFVLAFSGSLSSPLDQVNGAGNSGVTGSVQPGSITPSVNGALLVTVVGLASSGSGLSIDNGFTEVLEEVFAGSDHYGGAIAYLVQVSAAAINPTWTDAVGTASLATRIASFKPLPDVDLTRSDGKVLFS